MIEDLDLLDMLFLVGQVFSALLLLLGCYPSTFTAMSSTGHYGEGRQSAEYSNVNFSSPQAEVPKCRWTTIL
jgi:hypothetical protein